MPQIFGDYVEVKNHNQEYLKIGFSPSSLPLQHRWRNNGLSADFLADYLTTFFPGENGEALEKRTEIKDAVSYIANELLENAMKFSYSPDQHPVSITMQLEHDNVRFYVQNSFDGQSLAAFQALVHDLLSGDPDELYMERLMANAEGEHEGGSGLGFLTMLTNYNARLAWKFEPVSDEPGVVTVTTMVQLAV
jgi:hypothetical protein